VLLLNADGSFKVHVVGPDLAAGMRPQLLVPGNTFHAGLVRKDYALLGTSVWAKAEPQDVEIGDVAKLIAAYPAARTTIEAFAS
jgi:uncharacterized protein